MLQGNRLNLPVISVLKFLLSVKCTDLLSTVGNVRLKAILLIWNENKVEDFPLLNDCNFFVC